MAGTNCFDGIEKDNLREELKQAVDERIASLGSSYSDDYKVSVAIREVTDEAKFRLKEKKRDELLHVLAMKSAMKRLDLDPNDPVRGALTMWRQDRKGLLQETDVHGLTQSLIAENNGMMPALAKIRPRLFSMSVGLLRTWNDDIRKAGMGLATKNEGAALIGKQMKESIDHLTNALRLAGGKIGKVDGWFLPQDLSSFKLVKSQQSEWVAEVMGKIPDGVDGAGKDIIDRTRMKDRDTGNLMTERELNGIMEFTWDSVTTDGLNKWTDTSIPQGRGLARRRDVSRVIHYTPEGWLYINEKYGNTDTVNAFLNYRDKLAKDVAILQIFGPKPDQVKESVKAVIAKRLGTKDFKGFSTIDDFNDIILGRNTDVKSHKIAQADQLARSATTAALLGGALIPSIADFSTQVNNALLKKTGILDRLTEYFTLLRNSETSIEDAIDNMLIVDTYLSANATAGRIGDDSFINSSNNLIGRTAEGVLEKSGLTPHTAAGRVASIKSHTRAIGKDLGKQWDQLDDRRKGLYTTWGIDQKLWDDVVSKSKPEQIDFFGHKANILSFKNLRDENPAAFRRIHRMVLGEGERSVISTDPTTERFLNFGTKGPGSGSIASVLIKQLQMFKRFPAAAFLLARENVLNPNFSRTSKTTANLMWAATAMGLGAIALQSKQILAGKDMLSPIDDDGNPDWKFWSSASLYGGGMPFLGDVLLPLLTGVDDPLKGTKREAGIINISPTASLIDSTFIKPMQDVFDEVMEGDTERAMEELGGTAFKKMTRTGVNMFGGGIWYLRGALDRFFFDQWEKEINPEGFRERLRQQNKFNDKLGQDFFFAPGEIAPERAPQFGEPQSRF